jgi:predicted permease
MTIGVSWLTARSTTSDRTERGALTLIGGFPNTGFIGFPLANLAFGPDGLRLAIIYDQMSLIIPAIVVATIISERHGPSPATSTARSALMLVAKSPPVWIVLFFGSLRVFVLNEPAQLEWLGSAIGAIVGPVGFLLLGLSLPLHEFAHGRTETTRVALASGVRIIVAPALLWIVAAATNTEMPTAMYLIAAMPTAFHTLVISRLHGIAPAVVRLGVLVTTTIVVSATVLGTLLSHGS